jgi:hypothetical protein
MQVRPSSAIRATGAALAAAAGLDVLVSVQPDAVTAMTGAATWAVLNLGLDAVLRRLRVPAVLRAAAVGAAVYVADVSVSAKLAPGAAGAHAAAGAA